jgi:sialate O-acetylesterase
MIAKFTRAKETLSRLTFMAALALLSASSLGAARQNAAPPPFASPIFGDYMVLQRGKPNAIWGWSEPGGLPAVPFRTNDWLGITRGHSRN